VLNLRDVGGHATDSGRSVRSGVLWRGDAPWDVDSDARRHLKKLRLHLIVDLRHARERDRRSYDPHDFARRSASIPLLGDEPVRIPLDDGFEYFNTWVLQRRGDALGRIVSSLARPDALPALIHCAAGKDRTGVVIALIQAWLGVPDSVIGEDYSLSAERLRADTVEAIERQRLAFSLDVQKHPHLLEARPEWIIGALDWLRSEHGSPTDYLLAHGVRERDLDRLAAALLVPHTERCSHAPVTRGVGGVASPRPGPAPA
jgi:protein-tyrosine phosphatase